MKFLTSLLARFKEPSTWAGVGVLLQVAKQIKPQYAPVISVIEDQLPQTVAQISNYDVGSLVSGALAIFVAEKSRPK